MEKLLVNMNLQQRSGSALPQKTEASKLYFHAFLPHLPLRPLAHRQVFSLYFPKVKWRYHQKGVLAPA